MTYELERCPYCGGKAIIYQSDIGGAQILCSMCHCGTQYSYWKLEYAIVAWNRRAQDVPNQPLTPEEPKHTTHADRFRSMTNEELAVTLPCPNEMGLAEIACDHGDDKNCCACLLDWLNKPEEKK